MGQTTGNKGCQPFSNICQVEEIDSDSEMAEVYSSCVIPAGAAKRKSFTAILEKAQGEQGIGMLVDHNSEKPYLEISEIQPDKAVSRYNQTVKSSKPLEMLQVGDMILKVNGVGFEMGLPNRMIQQMRISDTVVIDVIARPEASQKSATL